MDDLNKPNRIHEEEPKASLEALNRICEADPDHNLAWDQRDLLRIRLGMTPELIHPCKIDGCGNIVYLDDKGTGDKCCECGIVFCDEHGKPGGSYNDTDRDVDYDWEGECEKCHERLKEEAFQAELDDLRGEPVEWDEPLF